MLPAHELLRARLRAVIAGKTEQGHVTDGLDAALEALPDSYDAFDAFAERLASLPLRADWPYEEPDDLDGIRAACAWPADPIARADLDDAACRIEAAFLARAAGCVLGKPFEFDPTMDELRAALEPLGEWPLRDYVPERARTTLRHVIPQWDECVREGIRYVAPDDDLNYTIIGMLVLEQHGAAFTKQDLRAQWILQLPMIATFGPERTMLVRSGMQTLEEGMPDDIERWPEVWNPYDEYCGALIRADAYGYACPGRPALAAELAWRDASFTHRRTGTYSTMFVAAALAAAPVVSEPLEMFDVALRFVPERSRFAEIVRDSLAQVRAASDWEDGYRRIHGRYEMYSHCRVNQEIGTVMNTVRFARDAGDGICMQVMQGNDTDSFGATAGSLLGMFYGPGSLENRWLTPFNDDMHTALAVFYERSLSSLAARMGRLPARLAEVPE